MAQSKSLRIGDLARASGLTVRALRHYEAIGLLDKARRTSAGQRVYSHDDVARLYCIVALRSLGLGLPAIGNCLEGDGGELIEIVRRHLSGVERQIEAQSRLRRRLQFMVSALERNEQPSTVRFLEAMESMKMFERYFSEEQLAELRERHDEMGAGAIQEAEREWSELIARADAARRAGVDPASPELRDLWQRWRELIDAFTGGDRGIHQSLERMYRSEGIEQASRGAISPELWEYIGRARAKGD
jgi:MerR family transcriptional regulator, thiopeptide resistance regulator